MTKQLGGLAGDSGEGWVGWQAIVGRADGTIV